MQRVAEAEGASASAGSSRPYSVWEVALSTRARTRRLAGASSGKTVTLPWAERAEPGGPAILDRLLHHCHVIQIDGRSFRLRDMEQKLDER